MTDDTSNAVVTVDAFAHDVLEGLSSTPKYLSSKYFYDDRGSMLFKQIMESPEYYLTNAELEVFREKSAEVIEHLDLNRDTEYDIVELGAGDGSKTVHLLSAMLDLEIPFRYVPIDISTAALEMLVDRMHAAHQDMKILPLEGDYFSMLQDLKRNDKPKVIMFLGSNMGNLSDDQSSQFIYDLGSQLRRDDCILLGVDLIKSADVVLPAYNDAAGVTAAFNLNLLQRINRELGAHFDVDQFTHEPSYTEEEGIARSFLVSSLDQEVYVGHFDKTFAFTQGEKIATEISRKYSDEIIRKILQRTDFEIEGKVLDSKGYFADYIIRKR